MPSPTKAPTKLQEIETMKEEHKATKSWEDGGKVGDKPPTPVTDRKDAEREEREAVAKVKAKASREEVTPILKPGAAKRQARKPAADTPTEPEAKAVETLVSAEAAAKAPAKRASKKVKRERAPEPKRAGHTVLAVRTPKHLEVLNRVLAKTPGVTGVDGEDWLLVKNSEAQVFADAIVELLDNEVRYRPGWDAYHQRMIILTLLELQRALPATTGGGNPIDRLSDAVKAGTISGWSFVIQTDYTPVWTVLDQDGEPISVQRRTPDYDADDPGNPQGFIETYSLVSREVVVLPEVKPVRQAKPRKPEVTKPTKLETITAMKAEHKAVQEWDEAGGVGDRPATPVTDKEKPKVVAQPAAPKE